MKAERVEKRFNSKVVSKCLLVVHFGGIVQLQPSTLWARPTKTRCTHELHSTGSSRSQVWQSRRKCKQPLWRWAFIGPATLLAFRAVEVAMMTMLLAMIVIVVVLAMVDRSWLDHV